MLHRHLDPCRLGLSREAGSQVGAPWLMRLRARRHQRYNAVARDSATERTGGTLTQAQPASAARGVQQPDASVVYNRRELARLPIVKCVGEALSRPCAAREHQSAAIAESMSESSRGTTGATRVVGNEPVVRSSILGCEGRMSDVVRLGPPIVSSRSCGGLDMAQAMRRWR